MLIPETHPQRELELERWTLKVGAAGVITGSGEAVRACLLYIHAVDYFCMSRHFSHRRARVPQEHSPKPARRDKDAYDCLIFLSL